MAKAPSLDKLREKEAELKAQIRDAKKAARAEKLKIDKQRAAIIGEALASEMHDNQELAKQLEPIILRRVTKVRDRKLLGLPPISK
jgi:hypothetical protein